MSDLSSLTYRELQRLCKQEGIDATGSRSALEERLAEHLKESGDITMNNVEDEDASESESHEDGEGDDDDQEDEELDAEAEQALQDAIEMEALTAGKDNDDEDEDDEDDEDDQDEDGSDPSKPELLGVLIRTPDAKTSEEDGDNDDGIVFVGVDALRDAFEDAMSEIEDEQAGSTDESDIDGDEAEMEWEPPKSKADGLATRVATGLSVIEFVVMLYVLAMDKVPAELLTEPPARAVFDAFLLRAATSQFWISFGIYCFLFFLLPILIGLIFGKHSTPESVLGYALSRAAIAYMLPFNLAGFAGQQRVLNTTAAVSIVLAFWEKQSAYADF